MTLKLPYIPGRDIKEWCDRHEIPVDLKEAQKAAILARRTEKKVLGDVPHIPKSEKLVDQDRSDIEIKLHEVKEPVKEEVTDDARNI